MTYSHQLRLKNLIAIINSCLLIFLLSYLLDYGVMGTYFSYGFRQSVWGYVLFCIITPLKIFVCSGFYGVLAELISGEKVSCGFRDLKANAREYWKVYVGLSAVPLVVHFFCYVIAPEITVTLRFLSTIFNIVVAYVMGCVIVRDKYIRSLKIKKKTAAGGFYFFFSLIMLYCIQGAAYYCKTVFVADSFNVSRLALFIIGYMHFLMFSLLVREMVKPYPQITERFFTDKDVYLVNPLCGGSLLAVAGMFVRFYPPAFVVVKALTPRGYRFREFNRVFWQEHFYRRDVLVIITSYTMNVHEAYKIAKEFKKRGATVVMGGPHVSWVPEEALMFCDSVVTGEAEGVWKDVIADYEAGTLKRTYAGYPSQECYSAIHKYLMDSPPAVIKDYIETTRGCKYNCDFCTIPEFSKKTIRRRNIKEVVALIKKVKGKYPILTFIDNNIYSDPKYSKELFKALRPLRIKWATQCSIDIARDQEALTLAKKAGCFYLLLGYEISGNSLEHQQGGKLSLAKKYHEYSRIIKQAGIYIKAHFIYGFESDSIKSFWQLWKFCFFLQPTFSVLSYLTPLPGSKIFYEMVSQNRLLTLNWRNYNFYTIVFKHPRLNAGFVTKLYPVLFGILLLTTSRGGYVLLLIGAFFVLR